MDELSQHILDLAYNSLEAGATSLAITIREDTAANVLEFIVRDNGRGIAAEDVPRVLDPFFTTKDRKRVGLGIPLLQEAVDRCDGFFEIEAQPLAGTTVRALFPHNHLDRAPLGDISSTISVILAGNRSLNLTYTHHYNGGTFCFETEEFKHMLGDIPMHRPDIMVWLEKHLAREIVDLREADNHEEHQRTG